MLLETLRLNSEIGSKSNNGSELITKVQGYKAPPWRLPPQLQLLILHISPPDKMSASARTSTTHIPDTEEYPDPVVLEKIESQRAPGELTPVPVGSPTPSIEEKLEEGLDEKLEAEEGPKIKNGKKVITHRPTGIKVYILILSDLTF